MKCAIVFLALFAVSQAAFTVPLSQQARPILSDAIAKMRLTSRSSLNFREIDVADNIVTNLQNQADALLNQIENALNHGQQVANTVVTQFHETVAQLQSLGGEAHGSASGILSGLLEGLGGIFGNLFGGSTGRDGVITDGLTNTVVDLINQWNLEHHISGALNSNIAQYVAGLIQHLGLNSLVQSAVSAVLGEELSEYVLGHFNNDAQRGLFDGVQAIAGQISAASQQLFASLSNTLHQLTTVASSNFQQLQTLATQFAQQAATQAHATVSEAAQNFLDFLKPYQQDLGSLYNQVVSQVGAIVNQI
jgi:ElaB/YqjD/DUF883 family membrane-anchored ribosome-binding protein